MRHLLFGLIFCTENQNIQWKSIDAASNSLLIRHYIGARLRGDINKNKDIAYYSIKENCCCTFMVST